jgi:hypothetical protein
MQNAAKTYTRRFMLAMTVYSITIVGTSLLMGTMPDAPGRIPLALIPVIPIGFALWAFLTYLNQMDELQQRIQLKAFAFAALTTGMLSFSYGMLETAGLPHLPLVWILPTMIALWGLSVGVLSWRYR